MRGMRRSLLAAVLVLAAWAPSASQRPSPNHAAAGDDPGSDVVCRDETPTGSSISRQVCRSRAQRDADRKDAEDLLKTPPATAPRRC
jgi:hypothetical protein